MKRTLFVLVGLALCWSFFFRPINVFADGVIFEPQPGRWDYSQEKNQSAIIEMQDENEVLYLSVGTDGDMPSGALWLFPIPAAASKVDIKILKSLPSLSGENIAVSSEAALDNIKNKLLSSQLYPIPIIGLRGLLSGSFEQSLGGGGLAGSNRKGGFDNVQVFEHIEDGGMTSEVVSAQTGEGLANYLAARGLPPKPENITMLDGYIGKNYSFVISWFDSVVASSTDYSKSVSLTRKNDDDLFNYEYNKIGNLILADQYPMENLDKYLIKDALTGQQIVDLKKYLLDYPSAQKEIVKFLEKKHPEVIYSDYEEKDNLETGKKADGNLARGVKVVFPTKKLFFPLVPTSAYGDLVVPADIRVLGFVSPVTYLSIKKYISTEYFKGGNFTEKVGETKTIAVEYTKVSMTAPSKLLTDDLWFDQKPSSRLAYSLFIERNIIALLVILFLLCSLLASMLAGFLVFKETRSLKDLFGYSLWGLFNFFTILGLTLAVSFKKSKILSPTGEAALAVLKTKKYYLKRRWAHCLAIIWLILSPVAILVVFGIIFNFKEMFRDLFDYNVVAIVLFFIAFIYILLIPTIYWLRKINSEDKSLFDVIKAEGISIKTFNDKRNLKYIIYFSLIYVFLAVLLSELLKLGLLKNFTEL